MSQLQFLMFHLYERRYKVIKYFVFALVVMVMLIVVIEGLRSKSSPSVPPAQMPLQRVGHFSLRYSNAFVLNEGKSREIMFALPQKGRDLVHSLSIYTSQPTGGFGDVQLAVVEYAPGVQASIDGAAAGATQQVSKLDGITNPEGSIKQTTVSGRAARRVSYKANRWGGLLGAECLVLADPQSNSIWQLQIIFSVKNINDLAELNNIRACADEILASAAIEPAP